MKKIAISGIDNTGKSQQIRLLSALNHVDFHFTKPLIKYGDRWPDYDGQAMADWWFEEVPINDFIDIVIEAIRLRRQDKYSDKINVYDRGDKMFLAVCVANWMTRTSESFDEVYPHVAEMFDSELGWDDKVIEIMLLPDEAYKDQISCYLGVLSNESGEYTEENERRYERYQQNLRIAVSEIYRSADVVRVVVDCPIIDVQNQIRGIINKETEAGLPLLGVGVKRIIAFGGLSECGKSSFAETLRSKHAFCRLKQRYFIERVKERGESETPEAFALEFLRYAETHYYIPDFTHESLHDPFIPAFMKLFWGDRYLIVFIEASEDVRLQRTQRDEGLLQVDAIDRMRKKDGVKLSRGANVVKDIADRVIVNESVPVEDGVSVLICT